MIGSVSRSYIRNCAIHHTFNRAVTVHGVKHLELSGNVAFETLGHTYFIEDGIESQNRIEGNLAVSTRPSSSLLDTDTTPASFWITNPSNTFVNNAAAGSARYGFWFDLQFHPTGPSSTPDVCPPGLPLGAFRGNVAHSNGRYGLRIFNRYVPVVSTEDPSGCSWGSVPHSKLLPTTFEDFTAFKCARSGVSVGMAGDLRFENFRVADNGRAGFEVLESRTNLGSARIEGGLVIGMSPAAIEALGPSGQWSAAAEANGGTGPVGVWMPQSENFTLASTDLVGFDREGAAFATCNHCDFPNTKDNDAKTGHLEAITLHDASLANLVRWNIPHKGVLRDVDGSVTGTAGAHLAARWPHLVGPCAEQADGVSVLCAPKERPVRVAVYGQQPFSVFYNDDLLVYEVQSASEEGGRSAVTYRNHKWHDPAHGWAIAVLAGRTWRVQLGRGAGDWEELDVEVTGLREGEHLDLVFNHTTYRDHFEVHDLSTGEEAAVSLAAMPGAGAATGASFYDAATQTLTVRFAGAEREGAYESQRLHLVGAECPRDGCPPPELPPAVEREPFERLWSNASMWPGGVLPRAGEDVDVPPAWQLVLDVPTPSLGLVRIYGSLRWCDPGVGEAACTGVAALGSDNTAAIALEAASVVVFGELSIGDPSAPYRGQALIRLTGTPDGVYLELGEDADGEYIDAGSRALVVVGKAIIKGLPRTASWTRLGATASAGAEAVTLAEGVDWPAGARVVLASSGHSQDEAEVAELLADAAGGAELSLTSPLTHQHFGAKAAELYGAQEVDVRAEVGLLSHNVIIEGAPAPAGAGDALAQFGAHVLVTSVQACRTDVGDQRVSVDAVEVGACGEGRMVVLRGSLRMSDAELRHGGQHKSGRTAILVANADSSDTTSSFTRVAVWNSHNAALRVQSTDRVTVDHCVVYNSRGSNIELLQSDHVSLRHNLALGAYQQSDQLDWAKFEALANFALCAWDVLGWRPTRPCEGLTVHGNVAAGSAHHGFLGEALPCGDSIAPAYEVFEANVAHSMRDGWLAMRRPSSGEQGCARLSGVAVHRTWETALAFREAAERVIVEKTWLADNLIGVAIVPVPADALGDDAGEVLVQDAVVIGASPGGAGGCGFDGGARACGSLGCGPRRGIVPGMWATGSPMPFPRQPTYQDYHGIMADAAFAGQLTVKRTLLADWNTASGCGNLEGHAAISLNPQSPDVTTPTKFAESVTTQRVAPEALAYFVSPDPGWLTVDDCVDMDCTGLLNTLVEEAGSDGVLGAALASLGGAASAAGGAAWGVQVLPHAAQLLSSDSRCAFVTHWNGYACTGTDFGMLSFESLDADRFTRRLHPVRLEAESAADGLPFPAATVLNSFMDHRWDQGYTSLLRLSRFPVLVEARRTWNLTFAGTPPRKLRLRYGGAHVAMDGLRVAVRIAYTSPELHEVRVGGQLVSPSSAVPTALDVSGAHHWDNPSRRLVVVIGADDDVTVTIIDAVQASLTMALSVEDFYDAGGTDEFVSNLAFTLGISFDRIRVIDVIAVPARRLGQRRSLAQTAGGVQVDFAVLPERTDDGNVPPPPAPVREAGAPEIPTAGTPQPAVAGNGLEALAVLLEQRVTAGVTLMADAQVLEVTDVRISEPEEAPCLPVCRGDGAQCLAGECTCDAEELIYFSPVSSIDELYERSATASGKDAGCYAAAPPPALVPPALVDSDDDSDSGGGLPIAAIAGGAAGGVAVLAVAIFLLRRSRSSDGEQDKPSNHNTVSPEPERVTKPSNQNIVSPERMNSTKRWGAFAAISKIAWWRSRHARPKEAPIPVSAELARGVEVCRTAQRFWEGQASRKFVAEVTSYNEVAPSVSRILQCMLAMLGYLKWTDARRGTSDWHSIRLMLRKQVRRLSEHSERSGSGRARCRAQPASVLPHLGLR